MPYPRELAPKALSSNRRTSPDEYGTKSSKKLVEFVVAFNNVAVAAVERDEPVLWLMDPAGQGSHDNKTR